jgi:hypothetical protein
MRLVVDTPAPASKEPDDVDVTELVDAPAEPVKSPTERLTEAFPGAVVEEEVR